MRFALAMLVLAATAQAPQAESAAKDLEAAATDQERAAIVDAHLEVRADIQKIVLADATDWFAKFDYDNALKGYRAVLAIANANKDDARLAATWRMIGVCLGRKNDAAGYAEFEQKALDLSARIGDKATQAEALLGLTAAYATLGRLEDAERVGRQGIALNQELGNQRRAAALQVNLSTILGEKGDQEAKAVMLREAIQTSEAGNFPDVLAGALNNLGVVYYDQGDYERSLQYLRRAADVMEKQPVQDKSRLATMHSNMAVMLAGLDRTRQAFAEYDKAAALAAGDEARSIHIRFNRGALYEAGGDLAKALEEYRAASAYYANSSLRTDAVRTNAGYAETLQAAGQTQAAVELGEKTLAEARSIGSPDLIRMSLKSLGEAYLTLGRREDARSAYLEAIAAIESVKLSGSQDERDNFFHHEKLVPYQGMVRLLLEDGKTFEALQYAEREKARLLVDVLRGSRAEILRTMTADEKQKERDLSSALAAADAQIERQRGGPDAGLLRRRTQAATATDQFHTALYQAHPELRVARVEFEPIRMEQVAELLRDADTALLEYTVTKIGIDLFAIERGTAGQPHVECYRLQDSAGLAAQIEQYRGLLAARDLEYKPAAQALYRRLLGPASALIRRKKRLVIVPDGALWELPFQALVNPAGRHVIEDAAVFYAPSLTAAREMLVYPRGKTDSSRTLLALGAPAATGNLPALPQAESEVRQIEEMYGRSGAMLTGKQALKERWKEMAPEYRILHLATHGVLDGNNPLYSYLVMSRAPGSSEDSMLTAREILSMNLQADVAVLSACETARGKFRPGEGLIGISWAFLVAGTPTTVVSQWKVDAAPTSKLMVAFHRNLRANGGGVIAGRAEALRAAVLPLLATAEYRHPFYWAGFVLIGNGY